MRTVATVFFALVTAVSLSGVPAWAQHGRGGHPGGGPPGGMPGMGRGEEAGPPSSHKPNVTKGRQTPSEILSRNTKLSNRISTLTGMNAQTACAGFRNLGQCVAAAEVSKNLGGTCTFSSLKAGMLAPRGSLGKAIHACDPKVNAKAEARKGLRQANRDIRAAGR